MKIRIRGDSIRLRLSQSEVSKIAMGEFVEEATKFPQGEKFIYRLETSPTQTSVGACFVDHQMVVSVPQKEAVEWADSETVAMKAERSGLFILIEKDFACLKPRENENEDESDLFANPNQAHGNCR